MWASIEAVLAPTSTAIWACGQNLHHFTNSENNRDNVLGYAEQTKKMYNVKIDHRLTIDCVCALVFNTGLLNTRPHAQSTVSPVHSNIKYLCVYPTISLNLMAVSTTVEKLLSRYIEMNAFCEKKH